MTRAGIATDTATETVLTPTVYPDCASVGGILFDNVSMDEAIERIDRLIARGQPSIVVTPNTDHVVRAQSDRPYADLVGRADLVLADGQPVVWASRLYGTPLKERVAGSDLMSRLCEHAARTGYRVFFLGGDPGAAEATRDLLLERHSELQIVGTYCPPMGFEKDEEENQRIISAIRKVTPDIVFVGLGSPKQEWWIDEHKEQYGAPVSIGVGISFSFISGRVRRAPRFLRTLGLEWAWRLACEPRRLWRRYLLRGARFAPIVLRDLRQQRRGVESPSTSTQPDRKTVTTEQPDPQSEQVVTHQQRVE